MYPANEQEALAALKDTDPELAATAEAFLWREWCRSGDPETDRAFRAGVEAMQRQQLADAEALFGRVIELNPGFAEGWNKRATVRFLSRELHTAIPDCRAALADNAKTFV